MIPILLMCSAAQAQCVATIAAVSQDSRTGSIKVTTEYELNGVLVQTGNTRYLETNGTIAEIRTLITSDIDIHCKNLIKRMAVHNDWVNARKLDRQKELTDAFITALQNRVGVSVNILEYNIDYKGKRINVKADGTHSVTNIP